MNRARVCAVVVSLVVIGCAGGPGANDPATPAVWSRDMTEDQKVVFMKRNVVPNLGPVFQQHDAKRFAEFGCETCHGKSHQNPHEFLPKLVMKDGALLAFTDKPDLAKFMASEVVPKMAAALGEAPYDETTKQGFGCAGCHQLVTQ